MKLESRSVIRLAALCITASVASGLAAQDRKDECRENSKKPIRYDYKCMKLRMDPSKFLNRSRVAVVGQTESAGNKSGSKPAGSRTGRKPGGGVRTSDGGIYYPPGTTPPPTRPGDSMRPLPGGGVIVYPPSTGRTGTTGSKGKGRGAGSKGGTSLGGGVYYPPGTTPPPTRPGTDSLPQPNGGVIVFPPGSGSGSGGRPGGNGSSGTGKGGKPSGGVPRPDGSTYYPPGSKVPTPPAGAVTIRQPNGGVIVYPPVNDGAGAPRREPNPRLEAASQGAGASRTSVLVEQLKGSVSRGAAGAEAKGGRK